MGDCEFIEVAKTSCFYMVDNISVLCLMERYQGVSMGM
jgi:hypothetical protein